MRTLLCRDTIFQNPHDTQHGFRVFFEVCDVLIDVEFLSHWDRHACLSGVQWDFEGQGELACLGRVRPAWVRVRRAPIGRNVGEHCVVCDGGEFVWPLHSALCPTLLGTGAWTLRHGEWSKHSHHSSNEEKTILQGENST